MQEKPHLSVCMLYFYVALALFEVFRFDIDVNISLMSVGFDTAEMELFWSCFVVVLELFWS
jgi:hypothetical protein